MLTSFLAQIARDTAAHIEAPEPMVYCKIIKGDESANFEQVVFAEVYAPMLLDLEGDMMEEETIKKMAYDYMARPNLASTIDAHHQEWPENCRPVESFIAPPGDPRGFRAGAWVMGVKIEDDDLWAKVLKGDICGFSFSGVAKRRKVMVEYDHQPVFVGCTEPDADNGHVHYFIAKMGENNLPIWGSTSAAADGHTHELLRGTATEKGGPNEGHAHRICLKIPD
jgi:hypothetical protein